MPISWLLSEPLMFVIWLLAIIVTLTLHEFFHAFSASLLGDSTAKQEGRMTLNPFSHIDPLGFVMLLFVGFGWAKPVPVNPYNFKNQRLSIALVSLAGPLSNLVGVLVFGLILKLISPSFGPNNLLVNFLFLLTLVNASLFLFNLIPIPPLDGSKVLLSAIPDKFVEFKDKYQLYGPYVLLFLVIADGFLPFSIFGAMFNFMLDALSVFL
jgi:Zn-dependent protease